MKKILFLIIVICISINGYAQNEFSSKFKPITPIKKPPKTTILPKSDLPEYKPYVPTIYPKNVFVVPKFDAIIPGMVYKRNQDLGSYSTNSVKAYVKYRDAAFVDGDKIRVYLNDKMIQPQVLLDGEFKGFQITLEKGINKIDFEALNEGFAPPNTAEFQVFDDKGNIISASQWNIGIGYKATIIVTKD